jgi:hypothetical protein
MLWSADFISVIFKMAICIHMCQGNKNENVVTSFQALQNYNLQYEAFWR